MFDPKLFYVFAIIGKDAKIQKLKVRQGHPSAWIGMDKHGRMVVLLTNHLLGESAPEVQVQRIRRGDYGIDVQKIPIEI